MKGQTQEETTTNEQPSFVLKAEVLMTTLRIIVFAAIVVCAFLTMLVAILWATNKLSSWSIIVAGVLILIAFIPPVWLLVFRILGFVKDCDLETTEEKKTWTETKST